MSCNIAETKFWAQDGMHQPINFTRCWPSSSTALAAVKTRPDVDALKINCLIYSISSTSAKLNIYSIYWQFIDEISMIQTANPFNLRTIEDSFVGSKDWARHQWHLEFLFAGQALLWAVTGAPAATPSGLKCGFLHPVIWLEDNWVELNTVVWWKLGLSPVLDVILSQIRWRTNQGNVTFLVEKRFLCTCGPAQGGTGKLEKVRIFEQSHHAGRKFWMFIHGNCHAWDFWWASWSFKTYFLALRVNGVGAALFLHKWSQRSWLFTYLLLHARGMRWSPSSCKHEQHHSSNGRWHGTFFCPDAFPALNAVKAY